MKVVKVLMIPLCCGALVVFLLVTMSKKLKEFKNCGVKPPVVAVLCWWQVLLGFFVCLTEVWKFGVYDAFLSILVFHAVLNYKSLPNWALGLIIFLQVGNLVAILGPVKGTTDGVFLPLGLFAADLGAVSFAQKGVVDHLVPKSCSAYFEEYFTLEAIEKEVTGHDPKVSTFGLCTDEFIATVVTFICVKMLMWVIMTALNAQLFGLKLIGKQEPYSIEVGVTEANKIGA